MTTRGFPKTIIEFVHNKVHEGRFFSGAYTASVANNATLQVLIQNGSDEFHLVAKASSGGDSTLQLFKDTTFSNAGTAVTMTNHNQKSSKVYGGTVTHTPTLTADGSQMNGTVFIPAGSGGNSSGGSDEFGQEFILLPNTTHLLRITNVSGTAQTVSAMVKGYSPNL